MKKSNPSPAFQQVLLTVVSFTLLSGAASIWLSTNHEDFSPHQTRIFETCNTTWNMGVGAIFGLLGSKATDLFPTEEDDE